MTRSADPDVSEDLPDAVHAGIRDAAELVEHLRYPEDMFRLQSDMYTLYHMTDSAQFFSTVDPWEIALTRRHPRTPCRSGPAS